MMEVRFDAFKSCRGFASGDRYAKTPNKCGCSTNPAEVTVVGAQPESGDTPITCPTRAGNE